MGSRSVHGSENITTGSGSLAGIEKLRLEIHFKATIPDALVGSRPDPSSMTARSTAPCSMASASITLRSSRNRSRQSGNRYPSAPVRPGSMTSAPCSVAPISSTRSSAAPRSASAASCAARMVRAWASTR